MQALSPAQNAFLTINNHLQTAAPAADSLAARHIADGMESIGHTLGFAECHLRDRVTDKTKFSGWLHSGTAQLFAEPEVLPTHIVPECSTARIPSPFEYITKTHIGTYTLATVQKPDSVLPEFVLSSARLLAGDNSASQKIKITNKKTGKVVDTGMSDEELLKILNTRFDTLDISLRSAARLQDAGIVFVGEYLQKSDAERVESKIFGRKSLNELKEAMTELFGGKLNLDEIGQGLKIEGWERPKV